MAKSRLNQTFVPVRAISQALGADVTTPSSPSQYSSGSNTEVTYSGVVYVTPTGKRYHYSASCAGKNARSTSLSAAKSSGKTPCRSCVE